MYCPQCGKANDDSAAFCGACGTDLQKYKEQWSEPAGQAGEAAASDPGAPSAADSGDTPAAEPQANQDPSAYAPSSAYPPPPAYPPPYQQQHQPTYQPPPYQQGGPSPQQPGYYQPGAYQPAGYQPGYGVMPRVASYMGWAIATLILCFWPTGIVAVVYASRVGNLLAMGDVRGAQEASKKAKTWCWVTFGIGIALCIIAVLIIIFAVAAGVSTIDYTY